MKRRCLLKLPPNRVRRNYQGGAGINWLHGSVMGRDGIYPEEWIASLVPARNPGMEPVKDEGCSRCVADGSERLLKELVEEDPAFYLGGRLFGERGMDMGFLLKILDSSMRLHVQAHPTAQFARRHLNSNYGKLECYYILKVRDGIDPYIRLGFQHPPSRERWRAIIETQDITAMDRCFEKIPVREGEVWLIPGGMPHAIGEGILMLEIMEPSDLAVRCEFERKGAVVPPEARFMGKGLDFCLDIFDYTAYPVEEIRRRRRLSPKVLESQPGWRLELLAGGQDTGSFEVRRLTLRGGTAGLRGGVPQVCVVTRGGAVVSCGGESVGLRRGDSLFVAGSVPEYRILPDTAEESELCVVGSVCD